VSFGDGVFERPQQQQQQMQTDLQYAVATASSAAATTAAAAGYEGVLGSSFLSLQPMQPNLLPGANRQKSMPLPTLQESPVPTPGTSPQLTTAAAAAAATDAPQGPGLALHDMQLQAVLLQQQLGAVVQHQQAADLESDLSNSPATAASFSGGVIGSFEEDHSLADFLADVPEGSDVSGGFPGSGGSGSVSGSSGHSGVSGLSGHSGLSGVSKSGVSGQQQQQQRAESPPCGRRDGRSFEFSRPHNMLGALFDSSSPAHVGNARVLR
jgi:hypothetical protein